MRRITVAVVVGVLVLGASACGGSSTDAADAGSGTDASSASPTHAAETTSPTAAPSISPTHATEPGEPELIPVEGYAYEPVDEATEAGAADLPPRAFTGAFAHLVTQDGEPAGLLVLIGLTPAMQDELDSRARREEAVKTITDPTRAPEVVKISGEEVWTTEQGNGAIGYVWFHGDTTGWLMSPEREAAVTFVTAYLAEANG